MIQHAPPPITVWTKFLVTNLCNETENMLSVLAHLLTVPVHCSWRGTEAEALDL